MSFLGKAARDRALESAREKKNFNSAPIVPHGLRRMMLISVEPNTTKGGYSEVVLKLDDLNDGPGRYRPLEQRWIIAPAAEGAERKEWMDDNLDRVAMFFLNGFDYEFMDAPNFQQFVGQFKKFCNRELQVVVYHNPELWEVKNKEGNGPNLVTDKDGQKIQEIRLMHKAQVNYVGGADKAPLNVNELYSFGKLKPEDQAKWDVFQAKMGKAPMQQQQATAEANYADTAGTEQERSDADVESGDVSFD